MELSRFFRPRLALETSPEPTWLDDRARGELAFWLRFEEPKRLEFFRSGSSRCMLRIEGPHAQFGFWEGGDVLLALTPWLRANGIRRLEGPIDFSTFGRYRLRLNHFETTPLLNDPTNGEFELSEIKRAGFTLAQKYVTYDFSNLNALKRWALAQRLENLPEVRVVALKEISERRWLELLPQLHRITDESFCENPGYAPIRFETFQTLFGEKVLRSACRQTSALSFDTEGMVTGFCLNFPHPDDPGRLLVKSLAVSPRAREGGAGFLHFIRHLMRFSHYEKVSVCQMRFGNVPSLILKGLASETQEFGLFRKSF